MVAPLGSSIVTNASTRKASAVAWKGAQVAPNRAAPAEKSGIDERGPGGIEFGDEGLLGVAKLCLKRSRRRRESGRARGANDIGFTRRIDGDARRLARLVVGVGRSASGADAEIGGVDE